ncbi:protein of unknown function (DUF4837) [Cyclonatronum proteinivorum]|uniref:DUF4837 domain-containing protein n=1 Tax=Cyclonatronum proteinivorum TaxID=1457365 RepID=A0A345UKW4_9BACT|nr:DUF4837 family protein [Cyclonatronum proteinivorum]AXJ01116.1 protein of unknown function (DUF4837) [Cyclonatronum proteinivorum]
MLHRRSIFFLLPVLFLSLAACQGDYRPEAVGAPSEVIVLMDSTHADGPLGDAIRNTFGALIMTMPREEPRFDLIFRDLRTNVDMDIVHRHKNVIIAGPIDDQTNVSTFIRSLLGENVRESIRQNQSFNYLLRNVWSRNQAVKILSGPDIETLSNRILQNERRLVTELHDIELERWHRYVYRRAEQTDLSRDILETHGWSFRIQHDYRLGVDTLNVLTLRRFLPDNDRWIWVWWEDDFDDFDSIDREWITNKREDINRKYIQGGSEGKFVRTDFNRPYEQRFMSIAGMEAYESRGIWRMENDLMGGPFINYTMFDQENNRLFMMEFGQFSPRWDQRRFLYQFEAMARTFVSNPEAIVERDS